MRDWEGAFISKSVVDRGISEWSTMADQLGREAPRLTADLEACLAGAPWGGGAEGEAFRQQHFRDGGPVELIAQYSRLAREITDAGDRLRAAIDNTRQTDADIRHDLTTGMMREI